MKLFNNFIKKSLYLGMLFSWPSITHASGIGIHQATEASLAALNFTLGATINQLDIDDIEGQRLLVKLLTTREAIRSFIDIMGIKYHNDYFTAIPWLTRDAINTVKMLRTNETIIHEKPPFLLYGFWDAIEAATIICAAMIHDHREKLANPERKAIIMRGISSLARLNNNPSPSKILTFLNTFFVISLIIYRKFMISVYGANEPSISLIDQINNSMNRLRII